MKLSLHIALITLFTFVLFNSCSAQTKKVENENELSIVFLGDSIAYYNGILNKDVKVSTIQFDTIAIKRLIKENKEKYGDRLRLFLKLTSSAGVATNAVNIFEIATGEEVYTSSFPLTKADKDRFKVEEFSWEPAPPVEIVEPRSVPNKSEDEDIPNFLVVIKKDKSVWYNEKTDKDDTALARVPEPTKENLKKIIAAYKAKVEKENIKPAYYIKGDNSMEYPQFKEIINAFKENDILKYKLVSLLSYDDVLKTSSEPSTMNLLMPKDEDKDGKQNISNENGALTLLLDKNDVVYYYEGALKEDASNFLTSDLSKIRNVIINKRNSVIANHVHDEGCKRIQEKAKVGNPQKGIKPDLKWQSACLDKGLVIVIKPSAEASYNATIAILDEMAICEIKRYAMVDLFPVEKELIKITNMNRK